MVNHSFNKKITLVNIENSSSFKIFPPQTRILRILYISPFSSFIIISLPAIFALLSKFFNLDVVTNIDWLQNLITWIGPGVIKFFIGLSVSVTTVFFFLTPKAGDIITELTTEFVCANDYLEHGAQKQLIQGNLDKLVDFITEEDRNCKIHFHSYSFGTLVAIDFLFPYGFMPKNTIQFSELLITIGTPFDFVNAYYPNYFSSRETGLKANLLWINIYSVNDALGSNFRSNRNSGVAEYGISSVVPININYDLIHQSDIGFVQFLMMYSIKVHSMYWDKNPEGQSCVGLLIKEILGRKLLDINEYEPKASLSEY